MTLESNALVDVSTECALVTLSAGPLSCVISPRCGGAVVAFSRRCEDGGTHPLLRPTALHSEGKLPDSPTDFACYPLIPFSNRIAHGRFVWNGQEISMPHPLFGVPHAIHGHGWLASWRVVAVDSRSLRLTYVHQPAEQSSDGAQDWPFAYQAFETFSLEPDGLTIALELVNQGELAMPGGLGLHPFFPKPPGARVTARVAAVWRNDALHLPCEQEPLPSEWRFPSGVVMDQVCVDHCFSGWNGGATIDWPDQALRLMMTADHPPFGHLVIYAPAGEEYVCVEPVSHMTDAVNRLSVAADGAVSDFLGTGLRVLAPGEALSGSVTFRVTTLPQEGM
ncbi:aldose 1-epimerase [Azospirillaceae bacterium]